MSKTRSSVYYDSFSKLVFVNVQCVFEYRDDPQPVRLQALYTNKQRTICAGGECFPDENEHKERNAKCGICQRYEQLDNAVYDSFRVFVNVQCACANKERDGKWCVCVKNTIKCII